MLTNKFYIGLRDKWLYKFVEEDNTFNNTVASFKLPNDEETYAVTFDVRSFVDGDNGKAELHLEKLINPLHSVYAEWYD